MGHGLTDTLSLQYVVILFCMSATLLCNILQPLDDAYSIMPACTDLCVCLHNSKMMSLKNQHCIEQVLMKKKMLM